MTYMFKPFSCNISNLIMTHKCESPMAANHSMIRRRGFITHTMIRGIGQSPTIPKMYSIPEFTFDQTKAQMSLALHCNRDISIAKSHSAWKVFEEFGKYPKAGLAETRWCHHSNSAESVATAMASSVKPYQGSIWNSRMQLPYQGHHCKCIHGQCKGITLSCTLK